MESKAYMERTSSNTMKDSGVGGRSFGDHNSKKIKDSWNFNNHYYRGDLVAEVSWPPRSYTCSFCKREFRSAQALGGHMNVHRRDRARLRQSTFCDPNFSSSSSSTKIPQFSTYTVPSLVTPSVTCLSSSSSASSSSKGGDITKTMKAAIFGVGELKGFMEEDDCKILKKIEIITSDLDISLCSKEDLDLELRLGSS